MLLMVPSRVAGATRPSHPTALPPAQAPPPPLPPQPQPLTQLLQKLSQQLLPAGLAMLSQEVLPNHNLLHQTLQPAQAQVLCMSSRGLLGKGVKAHLRLLQQGWTRPSPSLLSQHSRPSMLSSSNRNPPGPGPVLPAVPLPRQGLFTAVAPRPACPQPPSGAPPHKQQLLHHFRSSSKSNSSSGRHQQPGLQPLLPPHRAPHARRVPPLEAPGLCPTTVLLSQAWCRMPLP